MQTSQLKTQGSIQSENAEPTSVFPADGETLAGDVRGYRMRRVLATADAVALALAWLGAIAFSQIVGRQGPSVTESLLVAAMIPVWIAIAIQMGLYHRNDRRLDPSVADELGLLATLVTIWSWVFLLAKSVLSSGPNPVLPAVAVWIFGFTFLVLMRVATRSWARRREWFTEKAVLIGRNRAMNRVRNRLERHPEFGLEPIAEVELPEIGVGDTREHDEARFEEAVRELVELARSRQVARAIVASGPRTARARTELVRSLNECGVQIDLVAGEAAMAVKEPMLNYLEGLPVVTIPSSRRHRIARIVKRSIELVLTLGALVALSPLLAYCAIRIKLGSRGPVFYRQERVGKRRETFWILKFRSMVDDADDRKHEVDELNMHLDGDSPEMFKIREDPRVTRFGAWMRRWSIDELPQLLNVVKGDMALVGPRPLIAEEADLIEGHYEMRFRVLPGVTGAWQAYGRSDIGFADMLQLDYAYVMGWSMREDIKLIVRTVELILQGRGAY